MRAGAKQEKHSSIKLSKKTLKRFQSSPRRVRIRTVSCSTIHRLPEPRRKGLKKIASWRKRSSRNSDSLPASFLSPGPASLANDIDYTVSVNPGTLDERELSQLLQEQMASPQPLQEQMVAESASPQPIYPFTHTVSPI